jgi:hypothetical protein
MEIDHFMFIKPVIYASREIGLEVKAEKTKYLLLSRHQNAGQNDDIKTDPLEMWHS